MSPRPPVARNKVKVIVAVFAVVFVVVYALSVLSFAKSEGSYTLGGGTDSTPTEGLGVVAIPTALDPGKNTLTVRLLFSTFGSLTAPPSLDTPDGPSTEITVYANSYNGTSVFVFPPNQPMAAQELTLYTDGSWSRYPVDSYSSDLLMLATVHDPAGAKQIPITLDATVGLPNWTLDAQIQPVKVSEPVGISFTLARPSLVQAFAAIALILFILVGVMAASVAERVGSRRKKIEPTLLGWGAALLFALPTLRAALPGAPPIGAWIDILVFLWVLGFVILAYLVVVYTWIRRSAPPDPSPATDFASDKTASETEKAPETLPMDAKSG